MIAPQEIARLWHRHAASLELLARARCATPEDCVQQAFIRLASQDPPPDDPIAWLARVVRNLAIDECRSAERRRRHEQAAARTVERLFIEPDPYDPDMLDGAEVATALAQLEVEMRELITAHLWGGLTFRQLGVAFDVSPSVAHRRYTRALDELRQHLTTAERPLCNDPSLGDCHE